MVCISVPLKGVKVGKVDIMPTDEYLKLEEEERDSIQKVKDKLRAMTQKQDSGCSGGGKVKKYYSAKMNNVKMLDGNQHFFFLFITMLTLLLPVQALQRTEPPILPKVPFAFMSNAPTELCESRHRMPLELSYFHFVTTTMKSAVNQSISMFYTDRFGVFPSVNEHTGEMLNEGLPQLTDMPKHLEVAKDNIEKYIPAEQPGLAVLDFEEWRPQWDRNWGRKSIYRTKSIESVKQKNAFLTEDEAENLAKIVFESAAKDFFIKSIELGKKLRPKRLWGYYLYPDCYNYDYLKNMVGFTGKCPEMTKSRDDELWWLWKESTTLFPSIYLDLMLRNTQQGRMYARHRIQEAVRVSTQNCSYFLPFYVFIRPVYKDKTDNYLSELDLVNTIGESAALGAAGVVSWGSMNIAKTQKTCSAAQRHLKQLMNPYMVNVSKATQLCSEGLCRGQGRCVRKQWEEDVYLHLNPRRFKIQRKGRGGPLTVIGRVSKEDINWFDIHFDCMCYTKEPCRVVIKNGVDTIHAGIRGANRSDLMLVMILILMFAVE